MNAEGALKSESESELELELELEFGIGIRIRIGAKGLVVLAVWFGLV